MLILARCPEACFKIRKGSLTHAWKGATQANVVSTCRHSGKADRFSRECGSIQACM